MIDGTVRVDIGFEEPVSVPGLYNLAEAAIDQEVPVIMFGCKYNDKTLGPIYLIPEKDSQTSIITLSSFTATIGDDDMLTPVGYVPPVDPI